MTNGRLNIGLFTCHLDNEYAFQICKGAEHAAKNLNVNLIVFPGMFLSASFDDPENALYDYQYNSVFYYAHPELLDALIVSVDTISSANSVDSMEKFLEHFSDIPILTLESPIGDYPCLRTDDSEGLQEAIEHLIQDHSRKNICFVCGRKNNTNAMSRLQVYRDTLFKHNIPVLDQMIVYGDMSEYSRDVVAELLDKNPKADAIVFANDQMAIGGYAELKSRGYIIGKDISVIGFDDSPIAVTMDPPLSTVTANTTVLGYNAVNSAVKLAVTGECKSEILESNFIRRLSCGCSVSEAKISMLEEYDGDLTRIPSEELIRIFDNYFLGYIKNTFYAPIVYELFNNILLDIIDSFRGSFSIDSAVDSIIKKLNHMLESDIVNFFPVPKIAYTFQDFSSLFLLYEKNPEKRQNFTTLQNYISSTLSLYQATLAYNNIKDIKTSSWSSVYITRDTLTHGDDSAKAYSLMLRKLKELKFESSYIYTYDEPIKENLDGTWSVPKTLFLDAYYNEFNKGVLSGEARRIESIEILDNEFTVYDKRFTAVIVPIFTNEQHLGLFVANTNIDHFGKIYSTSLQLGASLKYMSLLKEQLATQQQLMLSLNEIHEKNELLNHLSTSDELTGVNNRRGFMEKVEYLINTPANVGRNAILLFADMDSLKVVNDKFGHKDGDFALRNIANILTQSFRYDDIIGRIGGDEFVAFAFVDEPEFIKEVQQKITDYSKELNDNCGKPYFIEMSVGISEFVCDGTTKIEDLLSQADNALYTNKRYKRLSIIK